MLTVLDLFSGIGGFSLGLERTGGFKTIAFCEKDKFCQAVLRKHWPGVKIYGDVRKLKLPEGFSNVVCGGFPCQDISAAGGRAGIGGPSSGLWSYMVGAIRMVRPQYVLVENVADIVHQSGSMGTVHGDLAALGYDSESYCFPASAIGAPHKRDRIWIIAHASGAGLEGWGLPEVARLVRKNIAGRAVRIGASWPLPPDVPGVGYGLPDWVDRIKSLGNSLVPQIPELIGRAILEAEKVQDPRQVKP